MQMDVLLDHISHFRNASPQIFDFNKSVREYTGQSISRIQSLYVNRYTKTTSFECNQVGYDEF